MTTCDSLRCLRPTDPDERDLVEVSVLICRATFSSPEERDDRTLHSVCLEAELAREAARESQRDAAMCVTDDGLDVS